ncbi:MAG: LOG family protein [Planctomycetes bacterium]|nr:LOG family protein [Planctomycetota bacterium]
MAQNRQPNREDKPRKKPDGAPCGPGPARPPRAPHHAVKAYNDLEFLNSPDARVIRILAEYLQPLQRFRRGAIKDTIVFFGSARARTPAADKGGARRGARRKPVRDIDRYYEDARRLAYELTRWSKGLRDTQHRFMVCSGGGPGIMEAANRGASEAGGETIGLNISIKTEQLSNPYVSRRFDFEFHYFFVRKFWFVYLAKAMVIFPGGFGTMDELFEILTLIQTEKVTKPMPVVLYGSDYWNEVLDFDAMLRWGTIASEDLELFRVLDDPKVTFEHLRERLETLYLLPEANRARR